MNGLSESTSTPNAGNEKMLPGLLNQLAETINCAKPINDQLAAIEHRIDKMANTLNGDSYPKNFPGDGSQNENQYPANKNPTGGNSISGVHREIIAMGETMTTITLGINDRLKQINIGLDYIEKYI
jgi:hypothetical protein